MEAYLGYIVLVIILVSVYVFVLIIKHEKAKLQRRDECLCIKCGYDLRGTPDRCPECGFDLHELDTDPKMPLDTEALTNEPPREPLEMRTPEPWEQWVVVHASSLRAEASALVDQLELRGIASQVREIEAPRNLAEVYLGQSSVAGWTVWVSTVDLPVAGEYVASLRRARRMRKSLQGRAK